MSEPTAPPTDHTLALREEFRHHLETFYAQLKLAPPYESVEKAIRLLHAANVRVAGLVLTHRTYHIPGYLYRYS